MNFINQLSDATAAANQPSLLAVTFQDIYRIVFWHALERCKTIFGSSSGKMEILVDYERWMVTVTIQVDHCSMHNLPTKTDRCKFDNQVLRTLSRLGLVRMIASSSYGATDFTWHDGREIQSPSSSTPLNIPLLTTPTAPARGVTISFSCMPIHRKLIAAEAARRSQIKLLINCTLELSLLAPSLSLRLSVCHAASAGDPTPAFKVLLSLSRSQDLVQRCRAAFGDACVLVDTVRSIAVEKAFASVRMTVEGFVGLAASADAKTQVIFLQGRVWPGMTLRGASHHSKPELTAFAALLSSFGLSWSDQVLNRRGPQTVLSSKLYEKAAQRIHDLPMSDKGPHFPHSFVLNITLDSTSQDLEAESGSAKRSNLSVKSFEAAVSDAVGPEHSPAEPSASRKRKRTIRPSTADENEAKAKPVSMSKARPVTASLANESYGPAAAAPAGMVAWRDPVNGRLFHIDQRTGHSTAVGRFGLGTMVDGQDGTLALARRLTLHGGAAVDRRKLDKGHGLSLCTHRAATVLDEDKSSDEFEDPSFDAVLALVPLPCAVVTTDTVLKSRFFDTRRFKSTIRRAVRDDESDVCQTKTVSLELAITRSDLESAQVINQVVGKFILCRTASYFPILFCIDQHAADERYRLERLLEQYVDDCAAGTAAYNLPLTLTLPISVPEYARLKANADLIARMKSLGWLVKAVVLIHASLGHAQVDLIGIPNILKEKTLTDSGRVKDQTLLQSAFADCVEKILASNIKAVEASEDWLARSRWIPNSLMEVLKSRACRSAIMFNDRLGREVCERMVKRLAACKFPFGCAHGRPVLVPLCEVTIQKGGQSCM